MAAARLLPLLRRRLAASLAESPAPSSRGSPIPRPTSFPLPLSVAGSHLRGDCASPPAPRIGRSELGISFAPPAATGLRSLLTVAEASNNTAEQRSKEQQNSETNPPPASAPTPESSFKVRDTSNLKISPRHDLAMIFTCKVCETRSMKMASRDSYENGVVVARCGGCNNLHLIADRLGWFGEPGSIEDFLAAKGEEVKKGSTDTLNFSLDDLVGSQFSSKGLSEQN